MPNADVLQLADDVASTINSLVVSGEDIEAARAYRQELDLGKFTGRKVRIFPSRYTSPDVITRKEDFYDIFLTVVIAERYAQPNYPPDDWIDERVNWVETLFNLFGNARAPYRLGRYWSQTADVTVVYDWDLLNEDKVFWSEIELGFRTLV